MNTERPKEYVKGPDVMSKSKGMQSCYCKTNCNQTTLDGFISSLHKTVDVPRLPQNMSSTVTELNPEPVMIHQESVEVEIPPMIHNETVDVVMPPAI
jgi:hypothetical protein